MRGYSGRRILFGLAIGILVGTAVGVVAILISGDSSLSVIGSAVGAVVGVSIIQAGRGGRGSSVPPPDEDAEVTPGP